MLIEINCLILVNVAQLDVDDATTAGSRTPYNTPPETRREYISELGEVLEALQSVGRRNSQPVCDMYRVWYLFKGIWM